MAKILKCSLAKGLEKLDRLKKAILNSGGSRKTR